MDIVRSSILKYLKTCTAGEVKNIARHFNDQKGKIKITKMKKNELITAIMDKLEFLFNTDVLERSPRITKEKHYTEDELREKMNLLSELAAEKRMQGEDITVQLEQYKKLRQQLADEFGK